MLWYILSRRVEGQQFVKIAVVQIAVNGFLDVRIVNHHTILIHFAGCQKNGDSPVMTVKTATLAVVRQR